MRLLFCVRAAGFERFQNRSKISTRNWTNELAASRVEVETAGTSQDRVAIQWPRTAFQFIQDIQSQTSVYWRLNVVGTPQQCPLGCT